jgi:N-acetylmuramic acid 6-phosphate etherase
MVNLLIEKAFKILKNDGRLFYIGSGTSGRLGILDASECLPTFGIENKIIGLIAGGDAAIRKSQEHAEDSITNAWKDLLFYNIDQNDMVIGISASGSTPYVLGGLISCKKNGITTGCITCNQDTEIAQNSDFPIEVIVGAEYISGSSRMKAGTAQKMILNMISSAVMIKLGRVLDNKMIDMKLSNNKLYERAIRIVESILNIDKSVAKDLIHKYKNIRLAIENYKSNDK